MSRFLHRSSIRLAMSIALVAALACLGLTGCGDDPPPNAPGPSGSTTFEGTIAGQTSSGTLTITVATSNPSPQPRPMGASAVVTATGTVTPAGGPGVALTGTYDDQSDQVSLTGGGWTLAGGLTSFGLEGTYSGPGGVQGVFSVQRSGTGTDTVIVVVGTYSATVGTGSGNFNFAFRPSITSGQNLHGNAFDSGVTTPIPLDGTATADGLGGFDISIVNPQLPAGPPLATGKLLLDGNASGTFDTGTGNSGTWTGTRQ
ncbi:MAG TPA: hypothetical protein VJY35_01605 [Candidatus Eisenbacteria bacterium]|nr:hypothetical protein [Candidatus Eisenbacteria bacterium]